MYEKKILLLKQINHRFAQKGKTLNGTVKLMYGQDIKGRICINNADTHSFGIWLLCVFCGDCKEVWEINNLSSFEFEMPCREGISCLLIKKEDKNYAVAVGTDCNTNYQLLLDYTNEWEEKQNIEETPTVYEEFLENTDNYYSDAVGEYKKVFDDFYTQQKTDYFDSVKEELQRLFELYPAETTLSAILPDSYWIRIQRGENHFALGLQSLDGKPLYICYAIPKKDSDNYHIIYQRASDGKLSQ